MHNQIKMLWSAAAATALVAASVTGCATLNSVSGGRLNLGSTGAARSSAPAESGGEAAPAEHHAAATPAAGSGRAASGQPTSGSRVIKAGGGAGGASQGCKPELAAIRSRLGEFTGAAPDTLADAKSMAEAWHQFDARPPESCGCTITSPDGADRTYGCSDPATSDEATKLYHEAEAAEFGVQEKIVRGAMGEDVIWARNYMFDMFRDRDRVANEKLRTLGHDVAKAYEPVLAKQFKENGGLGKKDNGNVMCVYSKKALPAGGKGATGFETHIDGPGKVYVGCRLQGPAEGQSGNIILYWNADTGSMERRLHEVDLGTAFSVGKTTWITGAFTLPAGEDFANTVHYTFDAKVVVRNVWKEETTLSSAVLTWHK